MGDRAGYRIREVEPRTGITAAKGIDEIREIIKHPLSDVVKLSMIEDVLNEVNES